jgi:hypothetical protein
LFLTSFCSFCYFCYDEKSWRFLFSLLFCFKSSITSKITCHKKEINEIYEILDSDNDEEFGESDSESDLENASPPTVSKGVLRKKKEEPDPEYKTFLEILSSDDDSDDDDSDCTDDLENDTPPTARRPGGKYLRKKNAELCWTLPFKEDLIGHLTSYLERMEQSLAEKFPSKVERFLICVCIHVYVCLYM